MAINWTSEYESQPRNVSNPGFINDSVLTLKSAISERMTLEHFFGQTESTQYGDHREGSARIFVVDTAGRTDDVTERTTEPGRVRVAFTARNPVPESAGIAVVDPSQLLDRTLDVRDENGDWQEVLDWDEVVHRSWDLDIIGRKRYTSENPEVQENLSDTTYDAMDSPTKLRADNKAVKRSGIKIWTDAAKDANIFDVTDSDNNIVATADGLPNPIHGLAETTANDISAQTIYADTVYGATYS